MPTDGLIIRPRPAKIPLLHNAVRYFAILVGIASFALVCSPVLAATPAQLDPTSSFEHNQTQEQWYIQTLGSGWSGTATTITLYGQKLSWTTGDPIPVMMLATTTSNESILDKGQFEGSDPDIVASTTFSYTQLPSPANIFTLTLNTPVAFDPANYYAIYIHSNGGGDGAWRLFGDEEDLYSSGTLWRNPYDYYPSSPEYGKAPEYGWGIYDLYFQFNLITSEHQVSLSTPADNSFVNDFNKWLVYAQTTATSTIRINYYDDYGGYWTDTGAEIYSPATSSPFTVDKGVSLHLGHYQAKAFLLNASSGIIAQSSWNDFTVLSPDYGATIASTVSVLQGGIFQLDECEDGSFLTVGVSGMVCQATNAFKSLGNIIFSNMLMIGDAVGSIVKGIFPINIIVHLSEDLKNPTIQNVTSTHSVKFINTNLVLLSSSSITSAATGMGFQNFRQFINYLMYAITGVIMIIAAILAVSWIKGK